MGNLICMPSFSSKESTIVPITDSSTWYPQPGQHISIRTFRELNQAPTSSPTSTRMEIHSNGGNSRSTAEVLEEAAIMLTTHAPRH
ncbi:C4 protein [Tomato leaf curl Tanzania virus]|uniref:C4 protein n=1 Tax=Tomato leaf curl Arusha virus TaxID=392761 RepID=Q0ZD42_9GEMI|nr:C4 protein [Tomato leaf curl Arusha virus]ABF61899.1 C4 protein [Tomato leaf curl Arusha virus]